MATETITVTVADDAWTPIVDGGNYASCMIQVASPQTVAIAIETTPPAPDPAGFIVLSSSNLLVPFTLDSTEIIYARGFNGAASIGIIQVTA